MDVDLNPSRIITAAGLTYSAAFVATRLSPLASQDLRVNLKAISSVHSLLTTAISIHALTREWPIAPTAGAGGGQIPKSLSTLPALDDRRNPLIFGKSRLGNAITSWETGYLLYDTVALLILSYRALGKVAVPHSIMRSIIQLARYEPVMLSHHLAILAALGYLQLYIEHNEERGVWIIVAFLLMNATNPLLHLRWWNKKRTGENDARIDVLFAVIFAAFRFGNVLYIFRKYGKFHGLGAWDAYNAQRTICKVGTGALFGLNAFWWTNLLMGMWRQKLRKAKLS